MLRFGQEPMLARPVQKVPESTVWAGGVAYEPKLDGYRALLFIEDGRCSVQSRHGHDITDGFADVASAAAQQLPDGVVVDGDIVVWGDGGLDPGEVRRRLATPQHLARTPATFVAFDVLAISGADVRSWPLRRRREALELLMQASLPPLELVPQTYARDAAERWLRDPEAAVDGLVVKGLDSPYTPGRRDWLKLRARDVVA